MSTTQSPTEGPRATTAGQISRLDTGASPTTENRSPVMRHKGTAALLVAGAVSANIAFAGLGATFDYPAILKKPAAEVLASFRDNQAAVSLWFVLLAASSALIAPLAVAVGRLSTHRAMRVAVPVGIAAAVVQVIGLLRWPLLVPSFAADAVSTDPSVAASALDSFATANRILGTTIGETLGYALTAGWTILVVVALGRRFAGTWFSALGATSAALILSGVLSPLELSVVDPANFLGYVLWSLWLLAFAVVLLRRAGSPRPDNPSLPAT
jgi:hypothetical protein